MRFSELFDDLLLMLNVRRLCVVVDSLIGAAKVCDFGMVLTGMIAWLKIGSRSSFSGL